MSFRGFPAECWVIVICALILTASTGLPGEGSTMQLTRKRNQPFSENGGNQFREYWNNLTTVPHKCFQQGSSMGKKKRKNNIYRCTQISDPLYTIWPQKAAKAAREASKPHQEEAVRAGGQAEPPLLPVARPACRCQSLQCLGSPGPAAHKPSPNRGPAMAQGTG